ncbi:hypothetical protein quinque_001835 [Culex quinquefasciatus]
MWSSCAGSRGKVMLTSYEMECNHQLYTTLGLIKYEQIQVDDIHALPYENGLCWVVILEKTVPLKTLLNIHLIDYAITEILPALLLMQILREFVSQGQGCTEDLRNWGRVARWIRSMEQTRLKLECRS